MLSITCRCILYAFVSVVVPWGVALGWVRMRLGGGKSTVYSLQKARLHHWSVYISIYLSLSHTLYIYIYLSLSDGQVSSHLVEWLVVSWSLDWVLARSAAPLVVFWPAGGSFWTASRPRTPAPPRSGSGSRSSGGRWTGPRLPAGSDPPETERERLYSSSPSAWWWWWTSVIINSGWNSWDAAERRTHVCLKQMAPYVCICVCARARLIWDQMSETSTHAGLIITADLRAVLCYTAYFRSGLGPREINCSQSIF